MQKITLTDSLARYVTFFAPDDPAVPAAPGWDVTPVPDLSEIRRPLPSRRRDYTCAAKTAKALWLGAPNGLTRYAPDEPREADRVMYFSANRELADNNVLAVRVNHAAENDSRWYTGSGIYRNVWLVEAPTIHLSQWGTAYRLISINKKNAVVEEIGRAHV